MTESNVIPFKAKAEGVFVRVPEGAKDVHMVNYDKGINECLSYVCAYAPEEWSVQVPYGPFELYGNVHSLTESQWAEVVAKTTGGWKSYRVRPEVVRLYPLKTATESGLSLMRSLGITEGNWIVILKR